MTEPASWLRAKLESQRAQFWVARINQTSSSSELDALAQQLELAAQAARNAARDALVRELTSSIRRIPSAAEYVEF